MSRYAKYREKIARLPEDAFYDTGKFATKVTNRDLQSLANMGPSSSAINYSSAMDKVTSELTPDEKKDSPYLLYLRKKRMAWLIKIIIALILIGALVAMYFLFVAQ